jgi:hypothetical protein
VLFRSYRHTDTHTHTGSSGKGAGGQAAIYVGA